MVGTAKYLICAVPVMLNDHSYYIAITYSQLCNKVTVC